MTTAEYDCQFI